MRTLFNASEIAVSDWCEGPFPSKTRERDVKPVTAASRLGERGLHRRAEHARVKSEREPLTQHSELVTRYSGDALAIDFRP